MARPRTPRPDEHVPTDISRGVVETLSFAGYKQEDISDQLSIDIHTLIKHYREQLDVAKRGRVGNLSNLAYRLAMDGSEKMIEFLLKTQGRFAYAKAPEEIAREDKSISLLEDIKATLANKS